MSHQPLRAGKLPAELLRELIDRGAPPPPELRLPPMIGEDAGVVEVKAGALIAATDPVTLTGRDVAAHAIMVNANDIAVMGARPRWYLCAVLLPVGTTAAEARDLFAGMHTALDRIGAILVGGHTEVTDAVVRPVVVGQMMGLREDGRFWRTGGVSEGDVIVQVGPVPIEGAAVLAVEAEPELVDLAPEILARAKNALQEPGISVVEPALRAVMLGATALHDPTEGGLSAGLYEMAETSEVAFQIDPDAVLWFEPGIAVCRTLAVDPWGVLASGTLLAAFPEASVDQALAAIDAGGFIASPIARAHSGSGVRVSDGRALCRYERDEVSRLLTPRSSP